ncbi:hypothetical protein LY78DRAFT_199163 [Colletotrichum sublineola]|nr:hypothetical protein LY78DRAFT_199163 [Colletotrichum sublineola]
MVSCFVYVCMYSMCACVRVRARVGAGSSRDSESFEDVVKHQHICDYHPQGQLSRLEQDPVPPPNSWDVLGNALASGRPISRILAVWPSLELSSTVDLLLMSTQADLVELLSSRQWPECESTGSDNLPLTLSPLHKAFDHACCQALVCLDVRGE